MDKAPGTPRVLAWTTTGTGTVVVVGAANLILVLRSTAPSLLAALTVAIAIPLLIALTRRPQRGLLILAALVPYDGLLLLAHHLPPLAAGWKEALVLTTLAASFVASRDARSPSPRRLPEWAPAVGGLLALAAVSAVIVGGARAVWGLKVTYFYVLVAVIAWRCPLNRRERDRLVTILIFTGIVTASYGVIQQALGHARLRAMGYEYNTAIRFTGGLLRSFSSFDNPFAFAYFLMLVILIGLSHALADPSRARSRVFFFSLPLLLLGLGASFVRGAWIGLVAGLVYIGLARFRFLLLGVPVVFVTFLVLPGGVSAAALGAQSGATRVSGWNANLSQIAGHPLGVGVGASNAAAEKVVGTSHINEVFHPDNEYYRELYELGVLGVWLVVRLLISAFRATRAAARSEDPASSVFALATAATVLAAAAASFVTTYLDTFPSQVYFWLLLSVVAANSAQRRDAEPVNGNVPDRAPTPEAA